MTEQAKERSSYVMSSLDNALKVMDILSVKDNLSLAELTRISKLDKTSVFKILYTLERRDYVFKTADARYRLGIKFSNYQALASERQSLAEIAMPYMRQLRDQCHETVYLGLLNTNGRVIVMHMEEGNSPTSIATRIGYELDAHCTAMGKVLLSWLDSAVQHNIVDHFRFKKYTDNTICAPDTLYALLDSIKAQGWGEDRGERYPGYSSLAVPVFDADVHCVASLSIVCREDRMMQRRDCFLDMLLAAARDLSYKLGY